MKCKRLPNEELCLGAVGESISTSRAIRNAFDQPKFSKTQMWLHIKYEVQKEGPLHYYHSMK